MNPSYLQTKEGHTLAYHHTKGNGTHLMFLSGFRSDMQGTKALALEAYAKAKGLAFTRFDYSGHGESTGIFEEGTIGSWTRDALTIFDTIAADKTILIGSSMGGWIMLLLALQRKAHIAALVGIAPAPDFTERLMWQQATAEQQQTLITSGHIEMPNEYSDTPYSIAYQLISESRPHLLLDKPITLHHPVRLIHGMQDKDVPCSFSLELAEKLTSEDVELTFIKEAGHRLSEPSQIKTITRKLDQLLLTIA